MDTDQTIRLLLFNVRVFVPSLFEEAADRPVILTHILNDKPSHSNQRTTWHIGNINLIDDNGFYFCLGRNKFRKRAELIDGDFVEMDNEDYPFSHCILDTQTGVCGIQKNFELTKDQEYLGTALSKVLNRSTQLPQTYKIEVDAISDPRSFIQQINDAERVTRFAVWVKRPNTFDVKKEMLRPLEESVSSLGGQKARASFTGRELEKEQVVDAARSIATTGDNAEASVVDKNGKTEPIKLGGTNATLSATLNDDLDIFAKNALEKMRRTREQIRNGGQLSDDT